MIVPGYRPIGAPTIGLPFISQTLQVPSPENQVARNEAIPEANLPRALNFVADLSGCGFWRMIWPEHLLNAYQKFCITSTNLMLGMESVFAGVKSVRIQRQAADHQVEFVKFLKQCSQKYGFHLIYEIDDIVFYEDIPHYNRFRTGFVDDKIRQNVIDIINMCDELTTTSHFMANYYKEKTGQQNVTVIPNYPPKFWMGRYFNERKIRDNYDKYRKKPRIAWCGSGAHFDVDNRIKQKDDFYPLLEAVSSTVDKYQWVFYGGIPLSLLPLVKSGKIEFHHWTKLYDYPEKVDSLNANLFIAPLQDNTFNRGKSDIKFIEGCAFGIPTICQDISTYKNAILKFTDGASLINQIESTLQSKNHYMKLVEKHWNVGKKRFLEDHLEEYVELYEHPYGSDKRVKLAELQKAAI